MNKSIVSLFLIITITAYIVPSNGEAETTATTEVVVLALRHLNFDMNGFKNYDRLMEMKHTFQSKIKYHYWETRNKKMAQNICDLAVKYPGKRILVTIGSEHGYAIRQELASCKNVVQLTFSQVISAQK